MADAKQLRELPDDELLSRLESAKEELFNLRFQFATSQLDNPRRIREVRHDVARILTILRERSTGEELARAIAAADEQALAESRDAQARGEKKGTALGEMAQAASIEQEAAAGAEYVPSDEEEES
jgi:large subunit ribosomal protein L29